MELWIVVTLAAAAVQNVRAILQRRLTGRLSIAASTYARFVFGFPLAWSAMFAALNYYHQPLPHPAAAYFAYIVVGGLAQILGNALFVHLIRASNFTVMTTYIKVETVFGAILSFVILDDRLSLLGMAGILVTMAGIALLSAGRGDFSVKALLVSVGARQAVGGVAVGALYSVASTSIRGASLTLGQPEPVVAAFFTLAGVTLAQTLMMTVWLGVRSPVVIRETFRARRMAVWIGITGAGASALWYIAFTLKVTAYVLALGQAEVIMAYVVSRFLFKEHTHAGEIAGIAVMIAGILAVAAAR